VVLTIAGSDSGGGAGIQADLKTFQAFGTFGTSAVTAVTVQNTRGVFGVHAVPVEIVRDQMRVVVEDLAPKAAKTGMLATRALVEAVAEEVERLEMPKLVVDPVMVATSSDRLLDEDAVAAVRNVLLPRAHLVTPNTYEAELLTGTSVGTPGELAAAGRALVEMGADAALVKGGHLEGDEVVDVLVTRSGTERWRHPRIQGPDAHGTGCTLSAGIAAGLARGRPLKVAVGDAVDYVARALAAAPGLGSGARPLNHLVAGPRTHSRAEG
jgi:hydroxymethylpyrimidine/phosphomethylpyrimidine kinase